MNWKMLNNQNGFTLIEILAAITLLSIVLVAFIPFFTNYANFTRITENKLTAINIADQVGHQVRENESSIPLSSIDNCSDGRTSIETILPIGSYPYVVNNKNYYAYICKSSEEQELNLYSVRIEIELVVEPNTRPAITHIYTYVKQESENVSE